MGWASRANARMRMERMDPMFAPVIRSDGLIVYVNPTRVVCITPERPLTEEEGGLAPDGNPWPTSLLFDNMNAEGLRVRGTPQMILQSWFGAPMNAPPPPPENRIVVPGVVGVRAR